MKKLVIILMMLLCAGGVQGQGRRDDRLDRKEMRGDRRNDKREKARKLDDRGRDDKFHDNRHRVERRRGDRRGDYRMGAKDFDKGGKSRMDGRGRPGMGARQGGGAVRRNAIHCDKEWQILWNGCHVRLLTIGKIAICEKDGDRILQADEIYLLPNGYYKIRNGSFWYICEADGDRISNIWGDKIDIMEGGIYRCYRGGNWHYYDSAGNERN